MKPLQFSVSVAEEENEVFIAKDCWEDYLDFSVERTCKPISVDSSDYTGHSSVLTGEIEEVITIRVRHKVP
jgi:hypothetical protein